jgi:UDP-N-acetylglucosamine 2-epimerase (non-hydrolysing)
MIRILVAFGTRPEVIKMAPVIRELRKNARLFHPTLLATGQHRGLLDQMLAVFDLRPDIDLKLMRSGQTLAELTAGVLRKIPGILDEVRPDLVLVQGDTTTAMAVALASFYRGIPVGHVEAGLRTGDVHNPFPEELNRKTIGTVATLHFAPTARAAANLRREDVPADRVFVTGNTVIDALRMILPLARKTPNPVSSEGRRIVLVTVHRRESFGLPLQAVCRALRDLAARFEDIEIVFPVHPNPRVRESVEILRGLPRISLLPPLDYLTFLRIMSDAVLVLSDSGGVQEEAPSLGKFVLVLREKTERPEGVNEGLAKLIPPDRGLIVEAASRLLVDAEVPARAAQKKNPYGDGQAAVRIAGAIASGSWRDRKSPSAS